MINRKSDLLARLDTLTPQEVKRYLVQELTRKRLGLVWEADLIERDAALNANMVFPQLSTSLSRLDVDSDSSGNLIIEGDNFHSLRLLKATHGGRIRVMLIDPPYNTGNKDWVYNDAYVSKDDRWKHSTWLEFMYQRMVLARDLLAPDGVILICINDDNRARLELMMDEVMPGRRVGSFVWRSRTGGNDAKGAFFSANHEHVLVYANHEFKFRGDGKSYSIYTDEENGRAYYLSDLSSPKDFKVRPNTFYPIHDPAQDIFYPCSPNRVWGYSSEYFGMSSAANIKTRTIEQMIADGDVWFPNQQRVEVFGDYNSLLQAIDSGDVPFSGKTPLLWADMPNLEFWIGKKIGYGRPRLKKFKDSLKNVHSPISSWLTPKSEKDTINHDENMPVVGATNEGTRALRDLFGKVVFDYPKPFSLIHAILSQASNGNDIILDFFAGSGTTGEVVMALNAEDGGNRKFILCSSTEATLKEPSKNLCRDVTSERIRRVIDGYGKIEGLGGDFAYLTLTQIEEADLMFEATPQHAYNLLCLRETGHIRAIDAGSKVWIVSQSDDAAIAVCPAINADTVNTLSALGDKRLEVYTDRPDSLADAMDDTGVNVVTHSLESALRWAQTARQFAADYAEAQV